jgi:hypothetical protein
MPTPYTFSSTGGASHGRPDGATTRAAVNAIFESSEALRKQAREELSAVARERRRMAREQMRDLHRRIKAKEQRFQAERVESTREIQSQLHEFKNNLHSAMTERLAELAASRKHETRALNENLARTHQEESRALAEERVRDMDAIRKNLAEFVNVLREENAARHQQTLEELGWSGKPLGGSVRPSGPARKARARKGPQEMEARARMEEDKQAASASRKPASRKKAESESEE